MKLPDEILDQAISDVLESSRGERTVKVMVQFPGHKPEGPYEADETGEECLYDVLLSDMCHYLLDKELCTEVPDQEGGRKMKVMVRFPGHKPTGPYEAEQPRVGAQYFQVWIDGTHYELPASWCTVVPPEPQFPAGFPVARKGFQGRVLAPWAPETMNFDLYTWPRAPWESAPDWANQWVVFSNATTLWSPGDRKVGDQFGNDTIVHIEERGE